MVRIPKQRSRPNRTMDDRAEAAITQAQYMIGIYAEILAMDKKIIERIRKLIVAHSDNSDREADLTNLRLILVQLEKVGKRIAFWNTRLQRLVKDQLSPPARSQASHFGGANQ